MVRKTIQEALPLVRRRMGLIVGPSATVTPNFLSGLNEALAKRFLPGTPAKASFVETGEAVLDARVPEPDARAFIREHCAKQKASASLSALAEVRWTAILSFSLDNELENRLQEKANERPTDQPVSVVDDLLDTPPPRSLPSFKLLGSLLRDDFVWSRAAYLQRRARWRAVVRLFADRNRDAPVVCLGLSECDWLLYDLLSEFTAQATSLPRAFLALETDPLSQASIVQRIVGDKRFVTVPGTIGELVRAGYDGGAGRLHVSRGRQLPAGTPFEELTAFEDVGFTVNTQLKPTVSRTETRRLLDLLFAPAVPKWDPVVYELDFRRTATDEVLTECKEWLARKDVPQGAVAVVGSAASGKTVILKRAAYELAAAGELVLWLRPSFLPDARQLIGKLFKAAAASLKRDKRVVVFADDPLVLGTVSLRDVSAAAESAGIELLLVVAARSSDWMRHDRGLLLGNVPLYSEIECSDDLDDKEVGTLPAYLHKIGVATTLEKATAMARDAVSRSAKDTLSMLFWLLPETQTVIAEAVREEFFRLGDAAGLARVILGETEHGSELLQRAYKMVAVASRFRTPLPLEVLVSALGVSYQEWLDAHDPKDRAAYGLFYVDADPQLDEGVYYRTRNDVVTRIIVDTINGGSVRHAGELTILESLIAACSGSQPVYREFCLGVLFALRDLDWVEYEQGLRLFDTALKTLPLKDKTLLHQKGVWIRKVGRDATLALQVFEDALSTDEYPFASKREADEHIHTSMAKATLDAMKSGKLEAATGKGQVLRHLSKARSVTFFNPSAVHVQAQLVMDLLDQVGGQSLVDSFALANNALADIDRSLILLRGGSRKRQTEITDVQMLSQSRQELISRFGGKADLIRDAQELWQKYKSPDGFVFVTRYLYRRASESGSGSDFKEAFEFAKNAIEEIERAGSAAPPDLYEAGLHVYYHWRVQQTPGLGEIDWTVVRAYARKAVVALRSKQDPLYLYLDALASAHLGEWTEAHAQFMTLRRMQLPSHVLWARRDVLRDASGNRRTVQGAIRRGGGRDFFVSPALSTEIYIDTSKTWPPAGQIAHAVIEFSFAGPTATLPE
jgi:hypothetical protein